MGITSSTESNTRNHETPPYSDWPDAAKTSFEAGLKEVDALFPPKQGDSSSDELKGDKEREEEADKRFCEFMKGGGCKEAYTAMDDCADEFGIRNPKCLELANMLLKCMYSHHDYYHPLVTVFENAQERLFKELDKELQPGSATKQAEGVKRWV